MLLFSFIFMKYEMLFRFPADNLQIYLPLKTKAAVPLKALSDYIENSKSWDSTQLQ